MADHSQVINEAIDTIGTDLLDTTAALETAVVGIVESGTPETARQSIVQAYETYAESVRATTTPLRDIAADTVENQTTAGIGSGVDVSDETVESTLLADATGTLTETVRSHAETVSSIVVGAAITGVALETVKNQTRAAVSGVFMQTDDPVTTRLQNQLRKSKTNPDVSADELRDLVNQIKGRLPVAAVGGSLADQLVSAAEAVVMKFDGAFTVNRAKRYNIKKYEYAGGTIAKTRPWCADLDGSVLTEEEILDLWSQDWAGKSGDNPWTDRGGYNCRHYWIPIEE
jgi:hypothetical protein